MNVVLITRDVITCVAKLEFLIITRGINVYWEIQFDLLFSIIM